MSKLTGTWFQPNADDLLKMHTVVAWAVVRVRDGKITSVWDNEPQAQVCASTGYPDEYRHVLLTGEYKKP
jgi:hypothetical protein